MFSTYSFADTDLVLNHPSVGQKTFTGKGLGSITIAFANDMSQHDTAADGSVMVSKIDTKSGTLSIAIQQTSDAQMWLNKLVNYLKVAPTSEFAQTTGMLVNKSTGANYTFNGITPQKSPDEAFQQTGQQVTWALLVAEIIKN